MPDRGPLNRTVNRPLFCIQRKHLSFNLRSKVILGLSLGIAAFSVHAAAPSNDVQLFKNIRFGQTAEEILKNSAMAPCAQTNDADLMPQD